MGAPLAEVNDIHRWDLVAEWLKRQLAERGLAKSQIVRDVRVDQRTLDKLLNGQGIARRDRLAALATYLGYRGDAFDLVGAGLEPVALGPGDEELDLRLRAIDRRLDRIEALIEVVLQPPGHPEVEP